MITPQTNTQLLSIANFLHTHDDFVICGHISPDGDCLGAQLALAQILRNLGKSVVCVLAADEPLDTSFCFLPGIADMVPAVTYRGSAQTFIAVDTPNRIRLGDAATLLDRCDFSLTIDHHTSLETMSDLVYVDPDASATSLLVWELSGYCGNVRDNIVATCAYTGLMTDTGRFQYQNTTDACLRAAAEMVTFGAKPDVIARHIYQNRSLASLRLEALAITRLRLSSQGRVVLSWLSQDDFAQYDATKADAEALIDVLREISGVSVACILREQAGVVRGSLRAKDDTDVSLLAQVFGGGGHRGAAGFTFEGSLDEAITQVSALLDDQFDEEPDPHASSIKFADDMHVSSFCNGDIS